MADANSSYRAQGCRRLGFRPTTSLVLSGRGQLHRRGHPGLLATVRLRPGDANLAALKLSLPSAFEFSPGGLEEICSRRDATRGQCPARSRIGSARAQTSLLGGPLKGSVYVAQPRGSGLPDIWTTLSGDGIEVSLRGRAASRDGRFVLDMAGLPDIPLSSFALKLAPGGAISLAARPCRGDRPRRFTAPIAITGQNATRRLLEPRIGIKARCGTGSG